MTPDPDIDVRELRVPAETPTSSKIGNPTPVGAGLLAFQLLIFGICFITVKDSTVGTNPVMLANTYSIIVAGLGQLIAGIICFFRGEGYRAQVLGLFGLWLIGFYLLAHDPATAESPKSAAIYLFALILPVTILTVPAIVSKVWPFSLAFLAIIGLAIFAGIGYLHLQTAGADVAAKDVAGAGSAVHSAVNMLHVGAIFGFIACVFLVIIVIEDVWGEAGMLGKARQEAVLRGGHH